MLDKKQVGRIAKELIDEQILKVERHQIVIHTITVPRDRLLFFQLALGASLNGDVITHKGEYGYMTDKTKALDYYGDEVSAWCITSNTEGEDDQKLLVTRKLATELYEVVQFLLGDNPPTPIVKAPTSEVESEQDEREEDE